MMFKLGDPVDTSGAEFRAEMTDPTRRKDALVKSMASEMQQRLGSPLLDFSARSNLRALLEVNASAMCLIMDFGKEAHSLYAPAPGSREMLGELYGFCHGSECTQGRSVLDVLKP